MSNSEKRTGFQLGVWSRELTFDGRQPLGGNGRQRESIQPGEPLEMNGIAWANPTDGLMTELCSIDALYPGDLIKATKSANQTIIYAASHTHTAPMLDQDKPKLGRFAPNAVSRWAEAHASAERKWADVTHCDIYRSEVDVPVYRRFDRPDTLVNRVLTRWARMYPNESQAIDRGLYLVVIRNRQTPHAVIAFHACHPVSRADPTKVSADFVAAIRNGVRKRFGDLPCVFLQGASGDIRPNITRKRVDWLPANRLNWRFDYQVTQTQQQMIDAIYREAAIAATKLTDITLLGDNPFEVENTDLRLRHYGPVTCERLRIGGQLTFDFVPFEVSHLFQRDLQRRDPLHFIVGCAQQTRGYLPHPSQLRASGYEVDGSRHYMGLPHPLELEGPSPW